MDSTRGILGMIGAVVWIMINDVIGGIAGLTAGLMAVTCIEPVLGGLAGCVLLVTVPVGLCAGSLMGVASLGWMAELVATQSRPALSHN